MCTIAEVGGGLAAVADGLVVGNICCLLKWQETFFCLHFILVNLKHKSGNLKVGKKKRQAAQTVSYKNHPRSLKGVWGDCGVQPGSLCGHIGGNCVY